MHNSMPGDRPSSSPVSAMIMITKLIPIVELPPMSRHPGVSGLAKEATRFGYLATSSAMQRKIRNIHISVFRYSPSIKHAAMIAAVDIPIKIAAIRLLLCQIAHVRTIRIAMRSSERDLKIRLTTISHSATMIPATINPTTR